MAYFIDGVPYTEEEYRELKEIIDNGPVDTFETVYRLNHETKTYEGRPRTEDEKIDWFVEVVSIGTVKLEDVPEEYRSAVENRQPVSEEEKWAADLMNEVSEYGY